MKTYFALFLLLFFIACKDKPTSDTPAASTPAPAESVKTPPTTPPSTPPAASTDAPVHISASNTAFLVGLWECTFALGATNETPKYKGRWFEFKNDDTFISGRYDQQTNHGTYTFVDDPKKILTLNYEKKEDIPNQWEIQGQGHENGMVFKGNTPLNTSGLQVKMQQASQRPKQ